MRQSFSEGLTTGQTVSASGQVGVREIRILGSRKAFLGAMTSIFVLAGMPGTSAETLESALSRAYVNNPDLNSQRAQVRAADENVPRAKSGYRPQVNGTADVGLDFTEVDAPATASAPHRNAVARGRSRGYGLNV